MAHREDRRKVWGQDRRQDREDFGGGETGGDTVRRYPLLPPGSGLGWTPYAWLVYLGSFLWWPATGDAEPWEIAASLGLVAVFLPLYFWGYWQRGWRIVWPALGMAILGTLGVLWNPSASVFFIYGAGYVAHAGSPRRGLAVMAGLLAWVAAVAWLLKPHPSFFLVASVFVLLIGGINLHFGQIAKKNAKLRRSQEEVQHLAQVAERERIGRDLHDLLGHTLSLITLKSELAGKLLDRAAEPGGDGAGTKAARREVAEIERISRRALAEVREAVSGYRASGLAAELERAAASLESAGITCRRTVAAAALSAARHDPKVEGALAFVLREAVTNVLRHSGAGHCDLRLSLVEAGSDAGPHLQLEVADDGLGGAAPDGFGVTGMRERMTQFGGSLERRGTHGTRITARLPMPGASEPTAEAPPPGAGSPLPEPSASAGRPGDPATSPAHRDTPPQPALTAALGSGGGEE